MNNITPPLLSDLQVIFGNVLTFIWSVTAGILLFQIIKTGFEMIFTFGETKKYQVLKARTPTLVKGFVLVLTAWIICSSIIALIGIKDPNGSKCFGSDSLAKISFQFVFISPCAGE